MWSRIPAEWRRYLWIEGRSSRREWWRIEIVAIASYWFVGAGAGVIAQLHGEPALVPAPVRILLAALMFWINVASTVRRLHDRNKSGWWALAYLFPVFGIIWHFIECGLLPPRNQGNRYGPPAPASPPPMASLSASLYKMLSPTAPPAAMQQPVQPATTAAAPANRAPVNRAAARGARAPRTIGPATVSAVNRTRSSNTLIFALAAALALVLLATALLTLPETPVGSTEEVSTLAK